MPTFANVTPIAAVDGVLYANAVPLTSTEADLFNLVSGLDPIPVVYGQAVLAIVKLVVSGSPGQNSTYVVMQTDLGDGVWVDVAWCKYTDTQLTQTFVLSAGGVGSINNAFQNSRASGSAPGSSGSNQMLLGGRIRFVGKTTFTGGSSASSGGTIGVLATIRYKLLGLN